MDQCNDVCSLHVYMSEDVNPVEQMYMSIFMCDVFQILKEWIHSFL